MTQQIEVPGEWASLAALMAFADDVEERLPLSDDQRFTLRLVIEEIATNIVKYGYTEAERGTIQVSCRCDGDTLLVSIRDRGRPFDPRDQPDPDLDSADPLSREAGGLGLFFVREFADQLSYRHDPATGWNELIVTRGR
jgi:anti-sigma regulatory factor (Ser/Thr protein kinase)